jgi:hypothetical protein
VTHPLDTGQNRRRRSFHSPVPRAPQFSYFFNPAPKTMRVNSGCATPTPGTPPQNHEPQASLLWALHHRAAARSSLFRSQTPSPLFRSLRIKILDSISAFWFSDGGREERTAVGQRVGRRPQAPHRRYAPQPSPHPVLSLPLSSPFPCRSLPLFLLQGTLWLSAIVGSIAYNWSRPGMKTSVKLIHARFVAPPFFCCFWSNIDVVSTWICRACWFI